MTRRCRSSLGNVSVVRFASTVEEKRSKKKINLRWGQFKMESAATGNNSNDNKYPDPTKKSCKFYSRVSNKFGDSIDTACSGYL